MPPLRLPFLSLLLASVLVIGEATHVFANQRAIAAGVDGGEFTISGGEEEAAMESETSRRFLAQQKYISYDALKKDQVPCNKRGQSYYNCQQHGQANPYHRACTAITRCARDTS
ncbi:hypothetical protein Cni_G06636 [Canna indica]|uniref:Uncharacterized protein n=1 Tax=Canna indica TaxID=4628 RepID=A0AAQ3Q4Z0_9LILI|nr:hypothetical protein Cni_G06636 [Canna indica]